MSTATQQVNQMPTVPQLLQAQEVSPEQLAEALGITRDDLAEAAYPAEAMSTATQQTNQMIPTRTVPQLRQKPSLSETLRTAGGLLPDLDPYIHAARGLGGGVGAAAEMLPGSDLERALELGGPLLGMAAGAGNFIIRNAIKSPNLSETALRFVEDALHIQKDRFKSLFIGDGIKSVDRLGTNVTQKDLGQIASALTDAGFSRDHVRRYLKGIESHIKRTLGRDKPDFQKGPRPLEEGPDISTDIWWDPP